MNLVRLAGGDDVSVRRRWQAADKDLEVFPLLIPLYSRTLKISSATFLILDLVIFLDQEADPVKIIRREDVI